MEPRTPETSVGSRANAVGNLTQSRATTSVDEPKAATPFLKVKDILVPTDFSEPSKNALEYALTFAKQFDAKVTLVYVVEPVAFSDFQAPVIGFEDEARKAALETLTSLREQQGDDRRYIKDIKVVVGKPFLEIVSLAQGLKLDLIVIATHGRTGLKHVLMGSTAERVVRHATCPVLVVRGTA